MPSIEVNGVTYTATVFVRHGDSCPDSARGPQHRKCNCRKYVLRYDSATQQQKKVSAKTRSWEKAEAAAREWVDDKDPAKQEMKRLQAALEKKEGAAVTIETAVAKYLADMIYRLGDNGTVGRARTLLGNVAADGTIKRNGKLFDWLDRQAPRPVFISDITPTHLMDWRNGWNYGDGTAFQAWCDTKTFFKFCRKQGWIPVNPGDGIRHPKRAAGNRTATFSDKQYDAIVAAATGNQRVHTFLALLRWSGMAIVDAVQFDKKSVDDAGVLRYKRQKTAKLATVKLPEDVQALIRSLPDGQPFRNPSISILTDKQAWRVKLQKLFKAAGITSVRTDIGNRAPHPHMLRDTCAVWYLRHGMGVHGVAKILGDNVGTVEKHYLPFVAELEKAHIAENDEILKEAAAKSATPARVLNIANKR